VPRRQAGEAPAAHDCFYKGSIADDIAAFFARENGFLTKDDLAGFEVPVEASISCQYGSYTVHSCDVWCQGIVLLETLKTLEHIDLRALGHNSIEYIHTIRQRAEPGVCRPRDVRGGSEIRRRSGPGAAVERIRR
jgi:gamma-glutamyltranspeptidase/glutathione hydrolase